MKGLQQKYPVALPRCRDVYLTGLSEFLVLWAVGQSLWAAPFDDSGFSISCRDTLLAPEISTLEVQKPDRRGLDHDLRHED